MWRRLFIHFWFCCNAALRVIGLGGLRNRKLICLTWKGCRRKFRHGRYAYHLSALPRSYMAHAFLLTCFLYVDYIERVWSMWGRQLYHKVLEINKFMSARPETILEKQQWRNKNNKRYTLLNKIYYSLWQYCLIQSWS